MENQSLGPSDPSAPPPAMAVAVGPPANEARRVEGSPPPQVIIHQGGAGFFVRLVAALGWLGFFFCGLMLVVQFVALGEYFDTTEGITEKYHSLSKFASNKVAIISVSGVIMDGDGFAKKQIDRVRQDKDVKAVVLRVESPGGTVTGADYILHHLKKLRQERNLPLVVSMGSIAASGGYYVAMATGDQERCIYAEPTTTTGSIGVLIPHYDLSGLLARFDVKDDTLATHPRKEMLSLTKPMTDDQRELIKVYMNEAFTRFKDMIKDGRPVFRKDDAALDKLATGEVFTANQAKQCGLIDEIGFVEDAIERAIEMAGLSKERTRVVRFQAPLTLFGLSMASAQDLPPEQQASSLHAGATPRLYYLWTGLSPALSPYAPLLFRR